jgi:hypothetical protein
MSLKGWSKPGVKREGGKRMKHQNEVPRARSEPVDIQDEVISALLWRAGELLDGRLSDERGGERTPCRSEFLSLGNGLMLPTVFERLFQILPQPIAHNLPAWSERPKLGRRETQVLQELAKGRLLKEIPRHIPPAKNGKPITEVTVKMFVKRIYEKLNVSSHAAWELLLFLIGSLSGLVHEEHVRVEERKGIIFEFTPDGRLVRSLDGEGNLSSPLILPDYQKPQRMSTDFRFAFSQGGWRWRNGGNVE